MGVGRFFTCALLLLLALTRLDAQEKVGPIVLLDPGHGGIDSGTVSQEGIMERELALYIAKECLRLNRLLFNNALNIYLTRYSDTLISLADRTRLAESIGADFYLSIHFNHNQDPAIKGVEVVTSINRQNHSFHFEKQSKLLAQQLVNGFH